MIGQTIAHYQITEKLGAGGMGEVYRAKIGARVRETTRRPLSARTSIVTDHLCEEFGISRKTMIESMPWQWLHTRLK